MMASWRRRTPAVEAMVTADGTWRVGQFQVQIAEVARHLYLATLVPEQR